MEFRIFTCNLLPAETFLAWVLFKKFTLRGHETQELGTDTWATLGLFKDENLNENGRGGSQTQGN